MKLLHNTHLPFVKYRYWAYAISLTLLLVSIVALLINGLNWSIDFTGGVAATLNLKPTQSNAQALQIEDLRKVINDAGFKDAEIQHIGAASASVFQIKMKSTKNLDQTKRDLLNVLSQKLPQFIAGKDVQNDVVQEINTVGAKAGTEMRTNAIIAVLISLVLMIIYVWVRFEFTFGLMAIVALFHDVLLLLGVFAITGKEITMTIIAALLTIVGYAINDTIVVFDRIREDLKLYRKDPIPVIFNRSINTTLSRTVITGGTTLLTTLSLYLFGGAVLHDFALTIILGIIFGTLGSIFVASNLVLDTYKVTHQEKQSIQHLTKKK